MATDQCNFFGYLGINFRKKSTPFYIWNEGKKWVKIVLFLFSGHLNNDSRPTQRQRCYSLTAVCVWKQK
jgi:hypothetical protein